MFRDSVRRKNGGCFGHVSMSVRGPAPCDSRKRAHPARQSRVVASGLVPDRSEKRLKRRALRDTSQIQPAERSPTDGRVLPTTDVATHVALSGSHVRGGSACPLGRRPASVLRTFPAFARAGTGKLCEGLHQRFRNRSDRAGTERDDRVPRLHDRHQRGHDVAQRLHQVHRFS